MKNIFSLVLILTCHLILLAQSQQPFYIRVNQVGYIPEDRKVALVFAEQGVKEQFDLIREKTLQKTRLKLRESSARGWGAFSHYYELDFSRIQEEGNYYIKGRQSGIVSQTFTISGDAYTQKPELLLEFMRQQRCGYNPYLDMVCHQQDGRSFYGKVPDSTYVDVSGGWHDAGDQLKYLITSSYATGHMLKAFELYPDRFEDFNNSLGQPFPNDIPDVLDEAKWGLDWILKLHTSPDQLVHQVADDRDHVGWKMPDEDPSDYGWGKNSYRVAYFANGRSQGLREHKSMATGFANLAGRSAAVLAQGARIWLQLGDQVFADQCRIAAQSLYKLGKENEGFQQGNSYGAPYRYTEETWYDDMEWGAAELFRLTGDVSFRDDAIYYARKAHTTSWMNRDSAAHYQYYPFINLGHFVLFDLVDKDFQDTLAAYYRDGIQYTFQRSQTNPFGVGVPFIWCSNNLLTSLNTQIILYEKMTGDMTYHEFLINQRDWLFGRNPWGTSMFTGISEGGEYPKDVHTSIWALTKKMVPGGLVDGPISGSIYNMLKGLTLYNTDEFAHLQNPYVVYHDDIGDYSTNEPTMDGTAGSIIMMAYWAGMVKDSQKK
ncbi:MAG: glycoside hydrolase family 9 protein [Cyclobacteriaceae bacterium]|nr:glycoside hydrolase family 9 protein [Cyclobacteriaceae bacterium SS2]